MRVKKEPCATTQDRQIASYGIICYFFYFILSTLVNQAIKETRKNNEFLDATETFVKNINNSLIERDQWIDSFEILLDKMMDYQSSNEGLDRDFSRLISMQEVLIKAMKYAQGNDEDLVMVYEMQRLKRFKEKVVGV